MSVGTEKLRRATQGGGVCMCARRIRSQWPARSAEHDSRHVRNPNDNRSRQPFHEQGLNMKNAFLDPGTGWLVTRERKMLSSGVKVIDTSITDPDTGDVYHDRRVATYP